MISEDLQARIRAAARELASAMTATGLSNGTADCITAEIKTLEGERRIFYEIEVGFYWSDGITIK